MSDRPRRLIAVAWLACGVLVSACDRGPLEPKHEYEEDLYVALDGTATLDVNASVAALVALRGLDLGVDPRARLDRDRVRAMFEGPGATVTRVSPYRRDRRRFVYVSVDVDNLRRLEGLAPFAWSTYRFDRRAEAFEFRQLVGKSAGGSIENVGWNGDETVAFRVHAPSRIPSHNATGGIQRGNILEWEQPLRDRLNGVPMVLEAQMEPESILYTTILLFASTIVVAAAVFGAALWWMARRRIDERLIDQRMIDRSM